MPRDAKLVTDTLTWNRKAAEDLRAAHLDLSATPPLLEDSLFHAQQSAEKAMKAFLTWSDVPFQKTHNLVVIGLQCSGVDSSLTTLLQRAGPLSEYAWRYRYPGLPEAPSSKEAHDAVALAEEVVRVILALLPPEVHP